MKENLLLLKDLLKLWKIRFVSTCSCFKKCLLHVLDDIVNKYNNTFQKSIEMKPIDIKSNSYGEYNVHSNEKKIKFKVGDHVRISKYKNIFPKEYTPNFSN